eukprot:m.98595 g.98595  ORF g.98595 m.98595 type:complete len:120 (+) comp9016_c5_seq2:98-457(+)
MAKSLRSKAKRKLRTIKRGKIKTKQEAALISTIKNEMNMQNDDNHTTSTTAVSATPASNSVPEKPSSSTTAASSVTSQLAPVSTSTMSKTQLKKYHDAQKMTKRRYRKKMKGKRKKITS